MTAPDLPGFVLARAGDREREAPDIHRADCGAFLNDALGGGYVRGGCDCGVPARVLADCAAKRAIVELHTGHHECVAWNRHSGSLARPANAERTATVLVEDGFVHENDPTLRLLALPYADHPDFSPEWRD